MGCNRGIYHNGWTAVTKHATPWDPKPSPIPLGEDRWELYADTDWTRANDLAAEQPERLAHLQRLWMIEVSKYNVLPLDDRRVERFDSGIAGRPVLVHGPQQLLYAGMGRMSENSVVHLKNESHSVTAQIEVPAGGASGVIVAQGGQFDGWALSVVEGALRYCYNLFGVRLFHVGAAAPLAPGDRQARVEFTHDGGGLGKGGSVTLYVDGTEVGAGRIDGTVPLIYSTDETLDLGGDSGSPVADDYPADRAFTGRIRWVQLDIADDGHDHLVAPEDRLGIAMARQCPSRAEGT